MTSGVSSIMISTPNRDSRDLIFLPSRPMILPFISSDGKETIETVLSFVTSWAYLDIARDIISLAFPSACSSASSSLFLM